MIPKVMCAAGMLRKGNKVEEMWREDTNPERKENQKMTIVPIAQLWPWNVVLQNLGMSLIL